jgi:hypothetical protein
VGRGSWLTAPLGAADGVGGVQRGAGGGEAVIRSAGSARWSVRGGERCRVGERQCLQRGGVFPTGSEVIPSAGFAEVRGVLSYRLCDPCLSTSSPD